MLEQPSEHKKELPVSYLKMPPYTFLLHIKGADIAVDPGELARAQWFWERRPTKFILSTEKAIIILTIYAIFWATAICLIPQAREARIRRGEPRRTFAREPVIKQLRMGELLKAKIL
jgi:hypothetical protein